jgi:ATP-binding cassette subfamily C (CFTR/MRP) protein 1
MDGTIKIDDVDIGTIPLSLLRKSLRCVASQSSHFFTGTQLSCRSLVAQDPFLWHASIRDNLDPEHELGDDDIWLALKRIGMSDAIASLPDKLDSVLEDRGCFSKGQVCLVDIRSLIDES